MVSASVLLVDDADAVRRVIIERKDPLAVHTGIPDIIGERRSIHIFNFIQPSDHMEVARVVNLHQTGQRVPEVKPVRTRGNALGIVDWRPLGQGKG